MVLRQTPPPPPSAKTSACDDILDRILKIQIFFGGLLKKKRALFSLSALGELQWEKCVQTAEEGEEEKE